MTHLPDMIARRNALFAVSGLRGKYPQLFVDDTFVGSYEECNDINEGGEFKEMLQVGTPLDVVTHRVLHTSTRARSLRVCCQ